MCPGAFAELIYRNSDNGSGTFSGMVPRKCPKLSEAGVRHDIQHELVAIFPRLHEMSPLLCQHCKVLPFLSVSFPLLVTNDFVISR